MKYRLFLGFILPPFIGLLMLSIMLMLSPWLEIKGAFLVFLLTSFVLVSGQSFIYALLMEFIINRSVHADYLVFFISSALGLISSLGIIILYLLAYSDTEQLSTLSIGYGIIGIVSGLISGVILRKHFNRNYAHKQEPRY